MNRIISVIIVDDEPTSIEVLKKDLQQYPDIEVISTTSSAEKAKKLILKYQPELLFMDVEMPEMTGFELIESIQDEISPETRVVFYTAYDKYLLDALRASAFDYLLKPYLPEDLEKLMERVKKSGIRGKQQPETVYPTIFHRREQNSHPDRYRPAVTKARRYCHV